MRNVETKEVVHGLYFSGRVFNRKSDAVEWLYEHFFNEEEESFGMEQLTQAMSIIDQIRVKESKKAENNHAVW